MQSQRIMKSLSTSQPRFAQWTLTLMATWRARLVRSSCVRALIRTAFFRPGCVAERTRREPK